MSEPIYDGRSGELAGDTLVNDIRNSTIGIVRYAPSGDKPTNVLGHVWVKEDDPKGGWRWSLYKLED